MILVLSLDKYEQGTDPVIDWLIYKKANFVKLTIQDLISTNNDFKIDVNFGRIYVKGIDVTDEIKVIWYRRFEDDLMVRFLNGKHSEQVLFELKNEVEVVTDYLKKILTDKIWMPHEDGIKLDKPEISFLAEKFSLKTPKSIITNNKFDVLNFQNEINSDLIIKPIRHSGYFIDGNHTYSIYTQKFNQKMVNELPENFVLTLFQECVDSEFEIRVFYLDGGFYSSAIIITDKDSDVVDVKLNFNTDSINWIPYQLPKEFEVQLDSFMKSINLNTGSMDILKTKNNEYIMLEINPVGQYNAPAYRNNFYLEEKIANWLINEDLK